MNEEKIDKKFKFEITDNQKNLQYNERFTQFLSVNQFNKFIYEQDERLKKSEEKFSNLKFKVEDIEKIANKIRFYEESFNDFNQFKTDLAQKNFLLELKHDNLAKLSQEMKKKFDTVYLENLYIPGLIGDTTCRFKSYKEFIEETLIGLKELSNYKEFSQNEFKFSKIRLDSLIKSTTNSSTEIENKLKQYVSNSIGNNNLYIKEEINLVLERMKEIKLENNKIYTEMKDSSIDLIRNSEKLKNKIQEFKDFQNEITLNVEERFKKFKEINQISYDKCDEIKSEFEELTEKFDEISKFIKDVRFKKNMGELTMIELKKISDKISSPKRQKPKSGGYKKGEIESTPTIRTDDTRKSAVDTSRIKINKKRVSLYLPKSINPNDRNDILINSIQERKSTRSITNQLLEDRNVNIYPQILNTDRTTSVMNIDGDVYKITNTNMKNHEKKIMTQSIQKSNSEILPQDCTFIKSPSCFKKVKFSEENFVPINNDNYFSNENSLSENEMSQLILKSDKEIEDDKQEPEKGIDNYKFDCEKDIVYGLGNQKDIEVNRKENPKEFKKQIDTDNQETKVNIDYGKINRKEKIERNDSLFNENLQEIKKDFHIIYEKINLYDMYFSKLREEMLYLKNLKIEKTKQFVEKQQEFSIQNNKMTESQVKFQNSLIQNSNQINSNKRERFSMDMFTLSKLKNQEKIIDNPEKDYWENDIKTLAKIDKIKYPQFQFNPKIIETQSEEVKNYKNIVSQPEPINQNFQKKILLGEKNAPKKVRERNLNKDYTTTLKKYLVTLDDYSLQKMNTMEFQNRKINLTSQQNENLKANSRRNNYK